MVASVINQVDVGNGIAPAWNEWQVPWLDADSRFRGSITVNMNDPSRGRSGDPPSAADDGVTPRCLISGEQHDLLGHRRYWPVYEAIAEAGLPLCLHPGQEGSFD